MDSLAIAIDEESVKAHWPEIQSFADSQGLTIEYESRDEMLWIRGDVIEIDSVVESFKFHESSVGLEVSLVKVRTCCAS
ncbi:MAG: hypothetical protein AAF394_16390 [Planctomycetota bacterium]